MSKDERQVLVPLKVVETVAALTHLLGDDPDDYQPKSYGAIILWHLPVVLTYTHEGREIAVDVNLSDASVNGEYIANRVKLYAVIGYCKNANIEVGA